MDGTMYVLLPIYNEAGNLERLFSRIREGMERSGFIYHIIAYNDGSTDGSADILAGFAGKYPLTNIGDTRNHGLGHGLRTLLREVCRIAQSDDDIAVVLDSDNSHNPELFRSMVDKTRQGFDVVIASRYLADSRVIGVSLFRIYLSVGASLMMRLFFH